MCRLYAFRASEPTKVECTLTRAQNALLQQSREDALGRSNPDGWGISYYQDAKPVFERRATAAFQDAEFSSTAERAFSQVVVAHVRMASVGAQSLENTHPFTYGHWTFAHNGTVTAFERLSDRLAEETEPALQSSRKGTTDSEQVFYWLLSQIARADICTDNHCRDVAVLAVVVAGSIRDLAKRCDEAGANEPASLNFVLTDGVSLIASRWKKSLYYVSREGIRDCEVCGVAHVQHRSSTDYRALVVASEPISFEPWQEVPDGTILAIDANIHLDLQML